MKMNQDGVCTYTKSGKWPDKKLLKIIDEAVNMHTPICPHCHVYTIQRGCTEVSWLECPKCKKQIGETLFN